MVKYRLSDAPKANPSREARLFLFGQARIVNCDLKSNLWEYASDYQPVQAKKIKFQIF